MSGHKFLIDTNIFIGLEDSKLIDSGFAEFDRKCSEHGVRIFVHEVGRLDIQHDRDVSRREISLAKFSKFEELSGVKLPNRAQLECDFGAMRNPNDEVDVALLFTLTTGVVDFLVTQDKGIHDRVKTSVLARRVFTLLDALTWLKQTFDPKEVKLPLVEERKAHEIDPSDEIFLSLRSGYSDFDAWWREKCIREHRPCWTILVAGELAGIIVRKSETYAEAQTQLFAEKILKICTFKVKERFRGKKFGELLLKQALWFADKNGYELAYLTAFPDQTFLIDVLERYGFRHTKTTPKGENYYEKRPVRMPLPLDGRRPLELDLENYPSFVTEGVGVFCVPIRGDYHRKLFPEIAVAEPLPLFGNDRSPLAARPGNRIPGNTIRKVYLCRTHANSFAPGDIFLFYQSKSPGFIASQCITSVGIVEDWVTTTHFEELVRLTAKRSVFSDGELSDMIENGRGPIKAINFLLTRHFDPPITLSELISANVLKAPPQSFCRISMSQFAPISRRVRDG